MIAQIKTKFHGFRKDTPGGPPAEIPELSGTLTMDTEVMHRLLKEQKENEKYVLLLVEIVG